ncbi:hypothetical protein OQA88_12011 [Cercophora sp. LCS_1]
MEPATTSNSRRPSLPDRNVTDDSIEDAYVDFVLYCNPAVPLDTETNALREAFRTPPKSGGKSFSTFTLYELIKKLENKELKTWAELALKLGVEPPDQEKGQSSQKIQQYAVRLKRWMHSMHVDAFFEYLMERPHPYWIEIPPESTPITETGRDGVAAEDDMALRALLPQIKPKRGRRKPDDDDTGKSPSQRPSPLHDDYPASAHLASAHPASAHPASARPDMNEPWSAHPEGRGSVFLFPPTPDPMRLSASMQSNWGSNDVAQTPLTAYPHPHSAITPITRNAFWADPNEPKSAISPPKSRSTSRRHGAKVVSSAWRGIGSTGKTRGRPPINRGGNPDGPFSAFPAISENPVFKLPSPTPERQMPQTATPATATTTNTHFTPSEPSPTTTPLPPQASTQATASAKTHSQPSPIQENPPARPAKRSRLSLQVPERVGGEVRLATPPLPATAPPTAPPVLMVNGQTPHSQDSSTNTSTNHTPINHQQPQPPTQPASHADGGIESLFHNPGNTAIPFPSIALSPQVVFADPTDRTHFDEVEDHFMSTILSANWFDAKGASIPPCSVDEAWGLATTVVDNLRKTAPTKEAFLINLSALVGGRVMMPRDSLRITRLDGAGEGRRKYLCAWELRFGDIRGTYTMEETVEVAKWEKKGPPGAENEAEKWKRMYRELTEVIIKREDDLVRLRKSMADCLKEKGL